MSCSDYDWKAYALGELDQDARRQTEAHAVRMFELPRGIGRTAPDARRTVDAAGRRGSAAHRLRVRQSLRAAMVAESAAALVRRRLRDCAGDSGARFRAGPRSITTATQRMIEQSVAQAVADTEQRHQKQLEEVLANYEEILEAGSPHVCPETPDWSVNEKSLHEKNLSLRPSPCRGSWIDRSRRAAREPYHAQSHGKESRSPHLAVVERYSVPADRNHARRLFRRLRSGLHGGSQPGFKPDFDDARVREQGRTSRAFAPSGWSGFRC